MFAFIVVLVVGDKDVVFKARNNGLHGFECFFALSKLLNNCCYSTGVTDSINNFHFAFLIAS